MQNFPSKREWQPFSQLLRRGKMAAFRIKNKLYEVWWAMLYRCERPSCKSYSNYGGRGISVCEEWRSYDAFEKWALLNGYNSKLLIDRIDNNGNYSPENCRWVTHNESLANRRITRHLTAFGETKTILQWTEDSRCKVPYATIRHRLQRGWTPDRTLTTPSLIPRSEGQTTCL